MSKTFAASNAACVAALLCAFSAAQANDTVPTYTAHYDVEYRGRRIGDSVHTLEQQGETYRFTSVTQARGIARLLRRRPLVEESRFELQDGMPRPLEFSLEDGTRRGEDNLTIDFDWTSGVAQVATEDGRLELPLEPGVHDRATLQLALMLELEAAAAPSASHPLIDDTSIKVYDYELAGEETLDTAAGTYETIKIVQRREDSSRYTLIWFAPDLRYLPVRIEQRREDETLTSLQLESVLGLPDPNEGP